MEAFIEHQALVNLIPEGAELGTGIMHKEEVVKPTENKDNGKTIIGQNDDVVIRTGQQLLEMKQTKLPCLLGELLPQTGLAVMVGSSDTGKSSFLRQLATDIVLKKDEVFGFKLNCRYNKAVYVSSEDDDNAVSWLLNKQNINHHPSEALSSLTYIFGTANTVKLLDSQLTQTPVDLVVLDTLTDFYSGNDFNNVAQVKGFFKKFKSLAIKHQCLIVFNHHLSKAKETATPNKNAVLGSMAVESMARIVLELRRDKFDSTLRHLIPLKGNYLPDELKQRSIELKFDSNMLFSPTGNSCPIEELGGNRNYSKTGVLKERAIQLKKEGGSVRAIAKELDQEFKVSVSKTTVSEWVKNIKVEERNTNEQFNNDQDGCAVDP